MVMCSRVASENCTSFLHGLQAGQLYVLLFFAPEVLHSDGALMRVLVDKHFPVGA